VLEATDREGSDEGDDDEPVNEGSLCAADDILDSPPAEWGPPGPDGAPQMELVDADHEEPPAFDAAHCPCLRDCRHFHRVVHHFEHGNAPGTLARQPRHTKLLCMAQPGVFLEMSADAPVLECSLWDPLNPAELGARDERRLRWWDAHPEQQAAAALASALVASGRTRSR
jgi:hypothetical protein